MTTKLIIDKLCDKIKSGVLELDYMPPSTIPIAIIHNGVYIGGIEHIFAKYTLTLQNYKYEINESEYSRIASLYRDKNEESNIDKTLTFLDSLK